jgi:serine/threonine protein kinase
MPCLRHPTTAVHGRYCAACLLEQALLAHEDIASAATAQYRVQLPLGETAYGAVYVVRSDDNGRLFRLKTWHGQAPPAFMERFEELRANLESWAEPLISVPLRAWVDQAGRPSVLNEFRKGLPILDCVRSGRLATHTGFSLLSRLRAATAAGHRRGLVHGSIGPGNVLVDTSGRSSCLLDSGLAGLWLDPVGEAPSVATDEAGYLALERAVRALETTLPGPSL